MGPASRRPRSSGIAPTSRRAGAAWARPPCARWWCWATRRSGSGARRAFLALPGVAVVEIIDLYHAYEYLWAVGTAVFGAETPAAAAWVEPLKTRLYEEGAAPVRAALEALLPTRSTAQTIPEAENGPLTVVRRALEYVTTHAARLDYPTFVARQVPIGS